MKSFVYFSAEKTIFCVCLNVLLLSVEFQTEPLVTSCYSISPLTKLAASTIVFDLNRMSNSVSYKKGRGFCLFINNVDFTNPSESRAGAKNDSVIVRRAMGCLNIEYQFEENKTAAEIVDLINHYKNNR